MAILLDIFRPRGVRARSARALERGIFTINNVQQLLLCFDKITTKLSNLLIFKEQDTKFSQNYYFTHSRFLDGKGIWRIRRRGPNS